MYHKLALLVLLLALFLPSARPVAAAPRCFPEAAPAISDCIDGAIRVFWERQGGLPVFGYPIGPAREVPGPGGTLTAQLFERARLELHPENAPPYDVLLGRLGADALARAGRAPAPPEAPRAGCLFFAENAQNLCPPFLAHWRRYGLDLGQPGVSQAESLALFGLPLGPAQAETLPDGGTRVVQWFERARFEDHGAQGVLLGLLGRELAGVEPPPPLAPPSPPALPPGGFIKVEGARLTRLGQPVQLKGVNYYPQGRPWREMWSDWYAPQTAQELRLGRDQLGINVVRVLLPYDLSKDSSSPGVLNSATIDHLRELAQIAGELDMRLIVTLFDFYGDFPLPGTRDETRDLEYLRLLLGNFVGDDRIMAWDIHNEPDNYELWTKGEGAQQVLGWLGRMADEIHRVAPNHLVTVGMGHYDNLWQPGPDGRRVVDYSDLVSVHNYNPADLARQLDELRQHTAKPIVLEEFGWPSGPRCMVREYNEVQQAEVYRAALAAARARVVGVLAWTLRDYDAGPTRRWDTREEHYGLFRADGTLKPAAALLRDHGGGGPLPSSLRTALPLSGEKPQAPAGVRFIAESGHYLKRDFLQVFELLGGRGSFGLPISAAYEQPVGTRNNPVVQYFDAAVLEYHPEATEEPFFYNLPLDEQLRRLIRPRALGTAYSLGRSFPPQEKAAQDDAYFPETGYAVDPEFRAYFGGTGGIWRHGPPISGKLNEAVDGHQTRVQYFRNGRIELGPSGAIEAGRLGRWALEQQCAAMGQ